MDDVMFIDTSLPSIGLSIRKVTEGKESKLVKKFIDYRVSTFHERNGTKLAVFLEPQIETMYPDIVFVEYTPEIYLQWNKSRNELSNRELKILYHLYVSRGASSDKLIKQLGTEAKALLVSLEKLLDANMIIRRDNMWQVQDNVFGVKAIEAVEAKIGKWMEALKQALSNKWFASESYALSQLDTEPKRKTVERFEEYGIGIYVCNRNGFQKVHKSQTAKLPLCYGSILFSEWIGRLINQC